MKKIIRLFGRSSNREKHIKQTSEQKFAEQLMSSLESPDSVIEAKISELRNIFSEDILDSHSTGKLLQIIDSLINMDALGDFYKRDRKLFKTTIKFLEKEAKNETNPEYMNVRMTLVALKYFIGEKKAFHKFLRQLEKNKQYHNEASILRMALEQGWTPNQGRIIVDCTVKCEKCGNERKVERMVSPTQIKEFYLNSCESCGGTEYILVHIDGQSMLQWKQDH